ncbi:MAG TPA: hypothetical protein VKO67_12600 [Smithellaceae bacterium]|nr:hypothetical protein [Smithellaceae bacterium]
MLEIRRKFFLCGGASSRLIKKMGWFNAKRYLLTGDEWGAGDAHRKGLVQGVTEPGKQSEKAMGSACCAVAAAPLGMRYDAKQAHR